MTANDSFMIGPVDHAILSSLAHYQLLTASQVCRLYYAPTSEKYAAKRLRRLVETDYVVKKRIPGLSGSGGSMPLIYGLGSKGYAFLKRVGEDVATRFRNDAFSAYEYLHIRHTLAANDFLIAAERLTDVPAVHLAERRSERVLKHTPVKVAVPGVEKPVAVCPDGWLDFHLRQSDGRRVRACIGLEMDLSSEKQGRWRTKVRQLVAYYDGPYQKAFGTPSLTIAVVAYRGEERLRELLRWTEAELSALGREHDATLFVCAALKPAETAPHVIFLEPRWYEPFTQEPRPLLVLSADGG